MCDRHIADIDEGRKASWWDAILVGTTDHVPSVLCGSVERGEGGDLLFGWAENQTENRKQSGHE